jgi:chaperonin GroEL (HSP60 family)
MHPLPEQAPLRPRQVAAAHHLQEVTRKTVEGRAKLGVSAFAEALLGIPKILAENSGFDAQVGAAACSGAPHAF